MWPAPIVARAIEAPPDPVLLGALDGATVPASFVLRVDVPGATSAKLIVDGVYLGKDEQSPFQFDVTLPPGDHTAKVRTETAGGQVRTDATFTVDATAPVPTPPSTTVPAVVAPPAPTPPPDDPNADTPPPLISPLTAGSGWLVVDTVDEIRSALATARPGDRIYVADGEYTFKPRLVASASGTAAAPITLRGSRAAVLRTKNASGDYGLHITGDHWNVIGLTVAHATKGIVLDGSVGTSLIGVEVYDIGDEGIHFRACSSDGVLVNSYVHDTGRNSAQYGEGVYVGSANSNWSKYACTDPQEGSSRGDNTERVRIENNVFEDITAEGADLKEGTDSGILRRNVFRRAGTSGMNSADSAVDAKGNNWLIEGNLVLEPGAPWDDDGELRTSEFADGFQSHQVYDGYGTGNVFRGNVVVGDIPGFGVGLYPALGNVVSCTNVATGAELGLVGNKSKPATCSG